jgi:hypothetical protein
MVTAKRKDIGKMFEVPPPDKAVRITEKRPDREGKRATLFQLPEAAKKQLAKLAIDEDTTM